MLSPKGRLKPDKSPPTVYRRVAHHHHRRAEEDANAELREPKGEHEGWFGRLIDKERRHHRHHHHQHQERENERSGSTDEDAAERDKRSRKRRDSSVVEAPDATDQNAAGDEPSDPAFEPRSETSERASNGRDSPPPQDSDGDATDVMTDSDHDPTSPTLPAPPQATPPTTASASFPRPAPPPASYAASPSPSAYQNSSRPTYTPSYPTAAYLLKAAAPQPPPPSFARPASTSRPISTAQQQQADLRFIASHPAPTPQVRVQQRATPSTGRPFERRATPSAQGLPGAFAGGSSSTLAPSPPAMLSSAPSRPPSQIPPSYPQATPYTSAPAAGSPPPRLSLPGAFLPRVSSAPTAALSPAYPPIQPPNPAYQATPRQPYLPGAFGYSASPPVPFATPQAYAQPQPSAPHSVPAPAAGYSSSSPLLSPTPYMPAQPESPSSSPPFSPIDYPVNYDARPDSRFTPPATQVVAPPPPAQGSAYAQQPVAATQPMAAASFAYPTSSYSPSAASSPGPAQAFEPVAASSQAPATPYETRSDPPSPRSLVAAPPAASAFEPQISSTAGAAPSYPSSDPANDPPDDRFLPQPSSSAASMARPPPSQDQPAHNPSSSAANFNSDGAASDGDDDDAFVPKSETLSRSATRPAAGGADDASDDADSFDARRPRQGDAPGRRDDVGQDEQSGDAFQPRSARADEGYDSEPDGQVTQAPRTNDGRSGGPYEPQERVRDSSDLSTGEDGDSRRPGPDDPDPQPDTAYRPSDPNDQQDQSDRRPRQLASAAPGDSSAQENDSGDSFTPRARSHDADTGEPDFYDQDAHGLGDGRPGTRRAQDNAEDDIQGHQDAEDDFSPPAAAGGRPQNDTYADAVEGRAGRRDSRFDNDDRKARSTDPSSLSDDELDAGDSASKPDDDDQQQQLLLQVQVQVQVSAAQPAMLLLEDSTKMMATGEEGLRTPSAAYAQDQRDSRGGLADTPPKENFANDASVGDRDDFADSANGAGRDASFNDGAGSRSDGRDQGSGRAGDFGGAQDDFSDPGDDFGKGGRDTANGRMDDVGGDSFAGGQDSFAGGQNDTPKDNLAGGQDNLRDQYDFSKDGMGGGSDYGGGGSGFGGGRDDDFGQSGLSGDQGDYGGRNAAANDDWGGQGGYGGGGDDSRDRNDFAAGGNDFGRDRDRDASGRDDSRDGDLQGDDWQDQADDDWRRREDRGLGDEEASGAARGVDDDYEDDARLRRSHRNRRGRDEEEDEDEEVIRARHAFDGERAQLERLLRGRSTPSRLVAALSAIILSCSALRYAQHLAGSRHLEPYPDARKLRVDDSLFVQAMSHCERDLRSELEAARTRSRRSGHARKVYEQVKSQLADVHALQARHHQRLHRKHLNELDNPSASREEKGAAAANAHYVAVHELHSARLAQAHARRHLEDCEEHGSDADIEEARDRLDQADERVRRAEARLAESEEAAHDSADALPRQHHLKIAEKKVDDAQEELDHLEKSGAPPEEIHEARQRLAAAQKEERHARAAHEADAGQMKDHDQPPDSPKSPPEEHAAAVAAVAQARRHAERHPDDPKARRHLEAAEKELRHVNERHERQHKDLAAEHRRLRSDPNARPQDVEEAHRRHHLSSVHEVARHRESLSDAEQELHEAERSAPDDHARIAHLRDKVQQHRDALAKAEGEEAALRNGLHPSHRLQAAQTAHEHAVSTVDRRRTELNELRNEGASQAQLEHAEERLRRAQDHAAQTSRHVEVLAARRDGEQHAHWSERTPEFHNEHERHHADLSARSHHQHHRLLHAKAEALAHPENRDKQAAYDRERDAHRALAAEAKHHKAHTSRAHRVQIAEDAAASAGASLADAQEAHVAAEEAHRAHPTAENERRLRAAEHRLHLAQERHGEASSKVQHQRHKASVEETKRRLESLDERASEAERREAERAHDDALRRHHHFRHDLLARRHQQVEHLRREAAAAPHNQALQAELHEHEEKLRRLKEKHDAHARDHPDHHPSLESSHVQTRERYEDARRAAHEARHVPLSAQQQREHAERYHAAAHNLHVSHRHHAMAALEESRRNSADNDAQERVVQHLKQSERFRDEAKHLRSQTSRPHRLHHAESAAADATHEVQRAKDEVDRARADHHRNESAESAHHLWEAERRHRLAQVASDHAHRRLKRQQHKMAVEDARRKLESAEVGTAEHEKASRDHATAQRQLHEHRQRELREDEEKLATLREEAREHPSNRALQLHLDQEQARHDHRVRKHRTHDPSHAHDLDEPGPPVAAELPASPVVHHRRAERHEQHQTASTSHDQRRPHVEPHPSQATAEPPTQTGKLLAMLIITSSHTLTTALSTTQPSPPRMTTVRQAAHIAPQQTFLTFGYAAVAEHQAAVHARQHASRREMEAAANLHAVKTAHTRDPTHESSKRLTAARMRLAVASHKHRAKTLHEREHNKGTSLDARLGTGRSSHTATEKHVEEVRQRHHAAQERHRQAPHDAAAAAEVEKHAHHLKLAEEAHARSASRKEHLERRRSHKHWAAEVSKAEPGSDAHEHAVVRHHRAATRLLQSREAKIKHLSDQLDHSKHLGGDDPSSRHHEHHKSLSQRLEKQRAKLAREKEEHEALSRHRSDILKKREMSHVNDDHRRHEHERAHREDEAVKHIHDEHEREAARDQHRKAEAERAEHLKQRRKDRREEKAREKAARAEKAHEKASERVKHEHDAEERRAKKAEEKKERRAHKHADWERRQTLQGEERKKADAAHAAERERRRKEKLEADAKHKEAKAAERAKKAKAKERAREAKRAEHLRHAREKDEAKRKAAAKRHREQQAKFERKKAKARSRKARKEARRRIKIPKVKKRAVRMPKRRKR
ncbi:Anti-sigma-I factor RsgI2 [Rhodotorula toruloides]|nr:Anti-sigma-I factor RsgI2 [Rhodotorula toruloides]